MPPPHEFSCRSGVIVVAVLIHPTGKRQRGTPVPTRNWGRTIARPVDLVRDPAMATLDEERWSALRTHHPTGEAHFWGAKARHAAEMRQLSEGDVVLLTGDSQVQAMGRIGVLLEAPEFGDALWPEPAGDGYVYVYSIDDLTFPGGLSYEELMRRSGTRAMSFRGLNVRRGARAEEVLRGLEDLLRSTRAHRPSGPRVDVVGHVVGDTTLERDDSPDATPPGESDLLARLEAMGGTDAAGAARAVRREQSLLREWLGIGAAAGDSPVQCGVCGRYLPRRLLVAAHVKPRSACTEEERKDIPHVAMVACALGCDALFEAGYLSVDGSGRIVTARRELRQSHALAVLRDLEGRRAPAWSPAREPYFAWHRQHRFLAVPAAT